MRVGFVSSRYFVDIMQRVAQREFDDIQLVPLTYKNFSEAAQMVREHQNEFDALIFSGNGAFDCSATSVKQTIIWRILTMHGDRLTRALLLASIGGYDLTRISCDGYQKDILTDIYEEIGIKKPYILFYPDGEDLTDPSHVDKIARFHLHSYQSGTVSCCITLFHYVYQYLIDRGIPCFFALPTYHCARETLQNVRLSYIAQHNQRSQIAVLMIKIDTPSKYSVIGQDEYQFHADKQVISDYVYRFASKIQAAVLEISYNTYLLFSTRHILEDETSGFTDIALLGEVGQSALHSVSVGIGYGTTAAAAKYNAIVAMEKAEKITGCSAYLLTEDGNCYGPLAQTEQRRPVKSTIDKRLYQIASDSQLSINRISQLNTIVQHHCQDCFTTKELAEQCGITTRSMDRILNRLEQAGYAMLVGKKVIAETGRPSRIMRLLFAQSNHAGLNVNMANSF